MMMMMKFCEEYLFIKCAFEAELGKILGLTTGTNNDTGGDLNRFEIINHQQL